MSAHEKHAFAERLKLALRRSARPVETPTDLALQFNLRHPNDPVTPQAAQKWLSGKAKPTADKIATLAEWLNVSAHWLNYGSDETRPARRQNVEAPRSSDLATLPAEERALLIRYRKLSPRQRELVSDLLTELTLSQEVWPANS